MLRWLGWSLIVIVLAGIGAAYAVRERQQRFDMEMGKRFPFTAREGGKLLIEEDGSPLRFRTREDARRYEQEYESPKSSEGNRP